MRGDMQPQLHHNERSLQNDSSSGSSSPHSNSSHEEILEVTLPDAEILPTKAIYNFSIPEVIKHEPRDDRHSSNSRHMPSHHEVCRKRKRSINSQNDSQNNQNDIVEAPVIVRNKRKANGGASANNDDVCRRQQRNVPVIDLTDADSHDEYNAHSDSEINTSSQEEARTFHSSASIPFHQMLSNLEHFQRLERLQNQEHHDRYSGLFCRSPSVQRFHRLRRRNEAMRSRQIVTDGPLVTEDMLIRTPEPTNLSTPDSRSNDDSIVVVNEVRGSRDDTDHAIALRMQNDPTYSPPYYSPHAHPHRRRLLRERYRAFRQRQQQEDYDLEPRTNPILIEGLSRRVRQRVAEITGEGAVHSSSENAENSRQNHTEDRSYASDNETNEGDVEFIGEWNNPPNIQPPLSILDPFPLPRNSLFFSPASRGRDRLSDLPFPDASFWNSFQTPPRLHHLHLQENYEVLLNLADRLGPAKPRGLGKLEIEKIPSFRFSTSTAKETNAKCVVCISEYTNREKLRRLPCSHDFHAKCIDKWLRTNKTCPVCRNEVEPALAE